MRGVVRDELERARPQQIADATEAAKGAFESSFLDVGGLPQVRSVVALWGELVDTGLLDRLRSMSVAPHLSLDVLEQRSKLATQQAVAAAVKETASLKDSTDRLLQHLPGFINAMASVPALANLIRQQRLEIDALKAADEAHGDFGATYEIETGEINARIARAEERTAGSIESLQASIRNEMQEVVSKLSTIEARVADEQKLLQSRFDSNCEAIKNEMVEQHHLWEALSRSNVETGNLWKAAELATREIGNLWQRVEFVRSEILYEIKYGLDRGHANSDPAVASSEMSRALEPQIRNPKLIDEAPPEGFKVNLGCGHLARAGYVNVDARHLPGVDVVADLGNLPFSKNTVGEFFSAHVLEHFPEEKLKRLLPYWRSLMKRGGRFCAIVPDGEASLAAVANGSYSFTDFREVLFGGQEYEGDFHFNLFTPDSLAHMLRAAKFKNIEIVEKGRRNGNCFEFEIGAEA